jgi:hypothetical protein
MYESVDKVGSRDVQCGGAKKDVTINTIIYYNIYYYLKRYLRVVVCERELCLWDLEFLNPGSSDRSWLHN